MEKQILITGASGLLGSALAQRFLSEGYYVFGQYYQNRPKHKHNAEWLQADFSSKDGLQEFLVENCLKFKHCKYLINNYGPITYKKIDELTADDFYFDFYHNAITAFEIIDFFLKYTEVEAVVNIGFDHLGEVKAYKKILTYAIAKNALQLITHSLAATHPRVRFYMSQPPTLTGATVKSPNGKETTPLIIAEDIFKFIAAVDNP